MIGKNQCEHGHLARSCELCDLIAENKRLQSLVDAVAHCYDEWDDGAKYHRVKIPNELWEQIRSLDGEPCPTCLGYGNDQDTPRAMICPDCGGRGRKA